MWKDRLILKIINKMENPHVFGAAFLAIHWILIPGMSRYQFTNIAYPALGAITALFCAPRLFAQDIVDIIEGPFKHNAGLAGG